MFSWLRKRRYKTAPAPRPPLPARMPPRPGTSPPAPQQAPQEIIRGKIAFSSSERSWEEEFDVVDIAARVLDQNGKFTTRNENALTLDTSEYVIRPVMVSFKPMDRGRGTQSCTVTRITHPRLAPAGLFEFQHSMGTTLNESLSKGFDDWAKTDLVTLLAALEIKPRGCLVMEMAFPAKDAQPERRRRVIFGPVAHLSVSEPNPHHPPEEHSFCPCCLLNNSIKPFKPIIESDGFYGLRLFATRQADGTASADCRINGQEFEPGKEALRTYVNKWLQRGIEWRKQYVVIQNAP